MPAVKTPLRRQLEARDCGAVALGIILSYFGRQVPVDELRSVCGVTRDGVHISGLVKAAQSYGLKTRALKRDSLSGLETPFIIFWNFNHFLVVEEVTDTRIRVNDPAQGRIYLTNALVDRRYSGILLTFEPTDAFVPTPVPRRALGYSVEALAYVAVEVSRIVPEVIFAGLFGQGLWVQMGILLITLWTMFTLFHVYTLLKIDHRYNLVALFRHLLYAPLEFFAGHYLGALAYRVSSTGQIAAQQGTALRPAAAFLRVLCYTAALVWIHPLVAFMVCLWAGLNAMIRVWTDERSRLDNAEQQIFQAQFQRTTFNSFGNIETLKLQGREAEFLSSFKHTQAQALSRPFAPWRVVTTSLPLFNLCASALLISGCVDYGLLTIPQGITAAIVSLLMLDAVGSAVNWWQAREDLAHTLEQWNDLSLTRHEPQVPLTETQEFTLQNVTFGYGDTPVVEAINLDLQSGKRIGLVGRSGSGKSTIVGLLTGLYRPWEGTVKIGTGRTALVDSQSFLVDGTVTENIACFDSALTDDRIQQAAQDALLHPLITAIPEGYQFSITPENHPFSAGALQRLEIARALAREPRTLLLDEAMNALDAVTEHQILDNITRRGCGCLIVSHRLSAVRDCDEIIVLEGGRIVQRGTHTDLLQQQGMYERLIAEGEIR